MMNLEMQTIAMEKSSNKKESAVDHEYLYEKGIRKTVKIALNIEFIFKIL